MKSLSLLLCAVLLGNAPASPALPVVNLMPEFWHVWDSTRSQPAEKRIEAFKEQVVLKGLPVYADGEFAHDLATDSSIERYFASLTPDIKEMRALSDELPSDVARTESAFASALPDFDSSKVIVYFLPSMWHFNGQTHDIGDKIGVLFGIDGIVKFDGAHPNIGVDIAHELFHVYQFEMHPNFKSSDATLWEAMWGEGSAAYASQELTTGATDEQALGSQLARLGAAGISQAACGIEHNWNGTSDQLGAEYFDAGSSPKGLPPRTGYLVGYLVAQHLNRHYTLAQIGKLSLTEIEPLARADVEALCKTGSIPR